MFDSLVTEGESFELGLLEQAVENMDLSEEARNGLEGFIERNDAIQFAIPIITSTCSSKVKSYGYLVIKNFTFIHWDDIEDGNKLEFKQAVIEGITALANEKDQVALRFANTALAAILAQDWPDGWPDFIDSIVSVVEESFEMFSNYLVVLKQLAENIDPYMAKVPSFKISRVSQAFTDAYAALEQPICDCIYTTSAELTENCVNFLDAVTKYVNTQAFLQSQLYNVLLEAFEHLPNCLEKLLNIQGDVADVAPKNAPEFSQRAPVVFDIIMDGIMVKTENQSPVDCKLPYSDHQSIILCLTDFIKSYYQELEANCAETLSGALQILFGYLSYDEYEIQKSAADFWIMIINRFIKEQNSQTVSTSGLYENFLVDLASMVVNNMPQPYKVVKDIEDEFTVIDLSDSDSYFRSAHDILVLLSNINPELVVNSLENLVTRFESGDVDSSEINSLAWSIAAVGASPDPQINELKGRTFQAMFEAIPQIGDNELLMDVAQGLMYAVAQSPKFVYANYPFFRKFMDFTVNSMEYDSTATKGVAVYAFDKIAHNCRGSFIEPKFGDAYLEQILASINDILPLLDRRCIIKFFGALAFITSGVAIVNVRQTLMQMLLEPLITQFSDHVGFGSFEPGNPDNTEETIFYIKCFQCMFVNSPEVSQEAMNAIFSNLCGTFMGYGQFVFENYQTSDVKHEKSAMAAIVALLNVYVLALPKNSAYLGELLKASVANFAITYEQSDVVIRVPSVPTFFGSFFEQAPNYIDAETSEVIMRSVFATTAEMIYNNHQDFLEFRVPLLHFIRGVIRGKPDYIKGLGPDEAEIFETTVKKLAESPLHEISSEAILIYKEYVIGAAATAYGNYLGSLAPRVFLVLFEILCDRSHSSCFDQITQVLNEYMKCRYVTAARANIAEALTTLFTQQDQSFFNEFLDALMAAAAKPASFRRAVRDLMLDLEAINIVDPELRKSEKEAVKREAEEERQQVPGMKPSMNEEERSNTLMNLAASLMRL